MWEELAFFYVPKGKREGPTTNDHQDGREGATYRQYHRRATLFPIIELHLYLYFFTLIYIGGNGGIRSNKEP